MQVLQLGAQGLQPTAHAETPSGIRCGTMHASPLSDRYLATGSLDGALQMWDLDAMRPVFTSKSAHAGSINTIDGCGGASAEVDVLEIAESCSSDVCCLMMYTYVPIRTSYPYPHAHTPPPPHPNTSRHMVVMGRVKL